MRQLLILLFMVPLLSSAEVYYVSTTGSDDSTGLTIEQAWGTWKKGFTTADAGDTVYFRGGRYMSLSRIYYRVDLGYGNSGTPEAPILFAAYPPDIALDTMTHIIKDGTDTVQSYHGNWPVLDCRMHCDSSPTHDPAWAGYNSAIETRENQHITLKQLIITRVYQCDTALNGAITATRTSNAIFNQVHMYFIGQRAFYISSGSWTYADSIHCVDISGNDPSYCSAPFDVPDTTKFINCDVAYLCDTLATSPGNGADAWKTISAGFNLHYWEGCRAWNYSDDAIDPSHGKRVFVNCWSMASNYYPYDGYFSGGNHNGIKTSTFNRNVYSFYTQEDYDSLTGNPLMEYRGCLSIYNPAYGFYVGVASDTTCSSLLYNNTGFQNKYNFNSLNFSLDSLGDVYRNNLSYMPTDTNPYNDPYEVDIRAKYLESHNIWRYILAEPRWEYNPAFTVNDSDFVTTDSLELVALFTGMRARDGSLPDSVPLMLKSTSDLIDGGTPVLDVNGNTTTYNGDAPDIGYYETGAADPEDDTGRPTPPAGYKMIIRSRNY